MFNVLRCQKCGHVITGQDDFMNTIAERVNRNILKMRNADDFERQVLIQENAMYSHYLKNVLDVQYRLKKLELKDTAFLEEILAYCRTYKILDKATLDYLREAAHKKQRMQAKNVSKELERIYGDYWNCCNNRTMPDPTARKALKRVMSNDRIRNKNWNANIDEYIDPICTSLPYSPKFI